MGHLARDCPNRGTRDDPGISLKRAYGNFVEMTGDRDSSSPVLTTTTQQEIVQYSDFNMSHVKVFQSSTVCSTFVKVTSFRRCTQFPSPSVRVFAEWAAFAVEDIKGCALLDTGASRPVGGYMMVQY